MQKVKVTDYSTLLLGETLVFEILYLDGKKIKSRKAQGVLEAITTRLKANKDKNNNIMSYELVGNTLRFIPENKFSQWGEQTLKVERTCVTAGMFRVWK